MIILYNNFVKQIILFKLVKILNITITNMATKVQTASSELEAWAKKFGVSTLFDYDKFENREFIKRLDEARPIYDEIKKQELLKDQETIVHDFR